MNKPNEKDSSRQNQLKNYVDTILKGAAEKGVRCIKFLPEDDDIAVYFAKGDEESKRVLSIPIVSFAELWRLALAPGFENGQHVMTVGSESYLFRIKEGRMALGEDVTIYVKELKHEEGFPFTEESRAIFKDEPWKKIGTMLDSIINLGLDRGSDRIEMHPGDPDVEIIYYVSGGGRRRLPISKQTFRQMVHYMREFYFVFGFASKWFGGVEYIIKPKLIGPGNDPLVILGIKAIQDDGDMLPGDLFDSPEED